MGGIGKGQFTKYLMWSKVGPYDCNHCLVSDEAYGAKLGVVISIE